MEQPASPSRICALAISPGLPIRLQPARPSSRRRVLTSRAATTTIPTVRPTRYESGHPRRENYESVVIPSAFYPHDPSHASLSHAQRVGVEPSDSSVHHLTPRQPGMHCAPLTRSRLLSDLTNPSMLSRSLPTMTGSLNAQDRPMIPILPHPDSPLLSLRPEPQPTFQSTNLRPKLCYQPQTERFSHTLSRAVASLRLSPIQPYLCSLLEHACPCNCFHRRSHLCQENTPLRSLMSLPPWSDPTLWPT